MLNTVHHTDFLNNQLPDGCAKLIKADPPYFRVKGEFDFVYRDFDEYLKYVRLWAKECQRILADNGSMFWFGDSEKIAYSQVILDEMFTLLNNITWYKGNKPKGADASEVLKGSFMGLENSKELKTFAPSKEHILFYCSQKMDATGIKTVEREYVAPRNPFAIELKRARLEAGVSINQVAEYGHFYGSVNHGGAVTNWEAGYNIPLPEQWEILCNHLPIIRSNYSELRTEYEAIRCEYQDKRRHFDNFLSLQDVVHFSNESHIGSKYEHATVKPETLTRALILTTTKPGDLVVVPFAGSGTEVAMAARENRQTVGYEIDAKNAADANARLSLVLSKPTLNF